MENDITILKDSLKEILEPIIEECLTRAMNKYINLRLLEPDDYSSIFDLEEAAKYIKLAKNSLYAMTSKRIIPHYKQGKHLYFRKDELDQWINIGKVTVDDFEAAANNYRAYRSRS
ncbi:MAG: helix-turn-helix domain-containing protein [Bacteroidales bacterium]|nr:helix-turn-helix domain-containing protein [Bacteroidales bacterium]